MTEKLSMEEIQKKIEEALKANEGELDLEEIKEDYGDDFSSILNGLEDYGHDIANFIPGFKHVDTDCCAGDGSEAYKVFQYEPTGQLFGLDGWYASYEGYNWNDGFKEMEPFTVTHYRPKGK